MEYYFIQSLTGCLAGYILDQNTAHYLTECFT